MEKWALITGAAGGIGLEFARLLCRDRYSVIMIDQDEERLKAQQKAISSVYGTAVETLTLDLSEKEAAPLVFDHVRKLGVTLDILINNAGFGMYGLFSATSWKREEKMINLHITTPTQLIKLFLPEMVERQSGKILNVSSLAGFHPGPLMCMYYSTKAYLLSFTTSVATELKGTGVNMTVLCPGITNTGFQEAVDPQKPKIKVTMADAGEVAAYGYRALNDGKIVAVPGLTNKLVLFLRRFMTYAFQARCVKYIQEKNR